MSVKDLESEAEVLFHLPPLSSLLLHFCWPEKKNY